MRATIAKRIRKQVYGDQSTKTPRKYIWDVNRKDKSGGIMVTGLRREYQAAKVVYKRDRRALDAIGKLRFCTRDAV